MAASSQDPLVQAAHVPDQTAPMPQSKNSCQMIIIDGRNEGPIKESLKLCSYLCPRSKNLRERGRESLAGVLTKQMNRWLDGW